jgi:hypothetical protein
LGILAVLSVGCADDERGDGTEGGSISATIGPMETSGDGDGDGDETGVRYDVGDGDGTAGTAEGGDAEGCTKVDLLFVIDNSGSMADEQQALIASFPEFVTGIQQQLENAESYHIGIVTSDAYSGNEPGCTDLGNLVTKTAGADASNQTCTPFTSGARFMDESEPDLSGKFACAGQVGSEGSGDEKQIQALLRALAVDQNGPGGCNEGFIRDDALLVIVIITDEDDKLEECIPLIGCVPAGGTPGAPPEWFQSILNLKGGISDNIVVLSVIGQENNSCGADYAKRILQFTNNFKNSSVGDICAASYGAFLTDAISIIDSACDDFIPPG